MKTLARAGHEVYVISPFPLKEPIANYHDISIRGGLEGILTKIYLKLYYLEGKSNLCEQPSDQSPNMFETEDWSAVKMINFLSDVGKFYSNYTLSHPNVQNLMKHEKNFDAVVVEVFWVEALYGEIETVA